MEFVHERSFGRINRSAVVTDGPVMPHPSSASGKKIRVRHVTIDYALKGEEWVVDGWTGLHLAGVVLRKDGSEGKETWGGPVHYSWQKMPEYAWLDRLIDGMRPEGVPELPFRLLAVENDDLENG